MSAKYFCDVCGEELKEREHTRVVRERLRLKVKILHTLDGVANAGHVCHKCILHVANTGFVRWCE